MDFAVLMFYAIPGGLAALLTWAVAHAHSGQKATRRAVMAGSGAAIWMAIAWTAADSGILRRWQSPIPVVFFLSIAAIAIGIARSPMGKRLAESTPMWALIGFQFFRLPLELAMHEMYRRGIAPQIMTYQGRNLDILTGLTAPLLAVLVAARWPRPGKVWTWMIWTWNAAGLGLLLNVAITGMLATPRFALFGDQQLNTWIADAPFVWLPSVMVLAAGCGHLLLFRAISRRS